MCQEDISDVISSRVNTNAVILKIHNLMIRRELSTDEEKLMLEQAKAKGVVRIEISTLLTWDAAQDLA